MLRCLAVFIALATGCATTSSSVRTEQTATELPTPPPPVTATGPAAEWIDYPQTARPADRPWRPARPPPEGMRPTRGSAGAGQAVAAYAQQLVGLKSLAEVSREVPDECTGFVRLSYQQVGVDVLGNEGLPRDNGVTALYRHARATGALHWHLPRPGDIAFFKETYDRNRDGKRNDGLTHVAIVESVSPDGTITLVHRSTPGVTQTRMNLKAPTRHDDGHGRVVNDYLRPASKHLRAYVTGELFAAFASAERLAAAAAAWARR